jgi:hypothetical protein
MEARFIAVQTILHGGQRFDSDTDKRDRLYTAACIEIVTRLRQLLAKKSRKMRRLMGGPSRTSMKLYYVAINAEETQLKPSCALLFTLQYLAELARNPKYRFLNMSNLRQLFRKREAGPVKHVRQVRRNRFAFETKCLVETPRDIGTKPGRNRCSRFAVKIACPFEPETHKPVCRGLVEPKRRNRQTA